MCLSLSERSEEVDPRAFEAEVNGTKTFVHMGMLRGQWPGCWVSGNAFSGNQKDTWLVIDRIQVCLQLPFPPNSAFEKIN